MSLLVNTPVSTDVGGGNMFKKLAVGTAAVALTIGMVTPTPAPPKIDDGNVTIMSPGIICIWLGWCK